MRNPPLHAFLLPICVGLLLLCGPGPAIAGDMEELDANAEALDESAEGSGEAVRDDVLVDVAIGEPQKCVQTQRIRRTEILDDRTVVFHMKGSVLYLNRLRGRCTGLRRADAFSYDIRTSRLCDIDTIRAVDYFGGVVRPGVACPLGEFQPISEEQLELLREGGGADP